MTTPRTESTATGVRAQHEPARNQPRRSTETKASFKTTEFIAYIAAVVAVAVVSLLVKHTAGHTDYFRADKAMFYIVLLTLGYMGSRGLAKSGSSEHYNDSDDHS